MGTEARSTRAYNWVNIIFFAVTSCVGLIGAPLYIYEYGVTGSEIALFAFLLFTTALSITVGYHRLFAHATFKTNGIVRFLLLFFGAASFEQSAMEWSSQHRDHHRYVDTDRDPYSIKRGFFYAHIGWLIFWKHETDYDNVNDLAKDAMVSHQHRHYHLWAIFAGIIAPVLVGALTGHMLGAFVLSVCLRLTLVYHSTFFINSICHMFGRSTYDIYATARDNWLIAFFTFGEGYHNFHHRFPRDYRNGVRWYQWDPSKWVIAVLGKLGLASNLKRVSDFRILKARLSGENRRVTDWLAQIGASTDISRLDGIVKSQYANLRQSLAKWEEAAREHKSVLQCQVARYSADVRDSARRALAEAREQFERTHHNWKTLLKQCPTAV